jgi:4-nitrophenol 2-monooxygenase / 4-nitrocatechol 4-monooxygenase, reductase component
VTTLDAPETGQSYRRAIGHFASGVTIVLTSLGGEKYGATASAVCSLSTEPAMLVVCLNKSSCTGKAVRESGRLSVNILNGEQAPLASRFGSKRPDRFGDVALGWTRHGIPRLSDCLVSLECRVEIAIDAATHVVFLCAVEDVDIRDGSPLTYFRGRFGSFAAVEDRSLADRVLTVLRSDPRQPYAVADLARRLEAQCAAVAEVLSDLRAGGGVCEIAGEYTAAKQHPESVHPAQEVRR